MNGCEFLVFEAGEVDDVRVADAGHDSAASFSEVTDGREQFGHVVHAAEGKEFGQENVRSKISRGLDDKLGALFRLLGVRASSEARPRIEREGDVEDAGPAGMSDIWLRHASLQDGQSYRSSVTGDDPRNEGDGSGGMSQGLFMGIMEQDPGFSGHGA